MRSPHKTGEDNFLNDKSADPVLLETDKTKSDNPEAPAQTMDVDTLNLLGDELNNEVTGPELNEEVTKSWSTILREGFEKETRQELIKKNILRVRIARCLRHRR